MHKKILKRFLVVSGVVALLFVIPGIGTAQVSATTSMHMNGTTTHTDMHGTTTVMVMKHLCNANIKNMSDFVALETGRTPVGALANTVLNCPATGLVGDMAVAGTVSAPREPFGFAISGNGISTKTLTDATFMPKKVCESDISIDVNSDGTTSPTTCLDISHYSFPLASTTNGDYVVTETTYPANRHLGAVRFTPNEMSMNNDSASLQSLDLAGGKIYLRTMGDTDRSVMLHVYNFMHQTGGGTGTTTPPVGTTTPPHHDDDDDDEDDDDNRVCHGHDMYGKMVYVTPGQNHGHDKHGNDVQMNHCTQDHMGGGMNNSHLEKIQKLQQRISLIQVQIIRLIEQLLAIR